MPAATAPVKKFVHRLVTDRDVEVAHLQVREDREKAASFLDERTKRCCCGRAVAPAPEVATAAGHQG